MQRPPWQNENFIPPYQLLTYMTLLIALISLYLSLYLYLYLYLCLYLCLVKYCEGTDKRVHSSLPRPKGNSPVSIGRFAIHSSTCICLFVLEFYFQYIAQHFSFCICRYMLQNSEFFRLSSQCRFSVSILLKRIKEI